MAAVIQRSRDVSITGNHRQLPVADQLLKNDRQPAVSK